MTHWRHGVYRNEKHYFSFVSNIENTYNVLTYIDDGIKDAETKSEVLVGTSHLVFRFNTRRSFQTDIWIFH